MKLSAQNGTPIQTNAAGNESEREDFIVKHYITKYEEPGVRYAESWLQITVLGRVLCFCKKRIEV